VKTFLITDIQCGGLPSIKYIATAPNESVAITLYIKEYSNYTRTIQRFKKDSFKVIEEIKEKTIIEI